MSFSFLLLHMEIFRRAYEKNPSGVPLAELIRPERVEDVVGQEHILGEGMVLRKAIETGNIFSMILWGPPGSGKTTIANVIARETREAFVSFSAVMGGLKEIRQIIEKAKERKVVHGKRTILFVDEIHRFNRVQQDGFLPHVEKGDIILIGATTENPSFSINSPLLSRCRILLLKPLVEEDIFRILKRLIEFMQSRASVDVEISDEHIKLIASFAGGDGRKAINTFESIINMIAGPVWEKRGGGADRIKVTEEDVKKVLGGKVLLYDRDGEEHYNTISAFIKSMRGSDPDAALYYLARMVEGGEDPLFILRRMVIFAAEDIGLADPQAIVIATSALSAFEHVGLPEGVLPMSEAVIYLSTAPKSNSVIRSYKLARKAVEKDGALPVPLHLRNPVTGLGKALGYGDGYKYPHDFEGGWVAEDYLPDKIRGSVFYNPAEIGYEKEIAKRLRLMREIMRKIKTEKTGGNNKDK